MHPPAGRRRSDRRTSGPGPVAFVEGRGHLRKPSSGRPRPSPDQARTIPPLTSSPLHLFWSPSFNASHSQIRFSLITSFFRTSNSPLSSHSSSLLPRFRRRTVLLQSSCWTEDYHCLLTAGLDQEALALALSRCRVGTGSGPGRDRDQGWAGRSL